jgi:8-oxo-dGTP diphosphatase
MINPTAPRWAAAHLRRAPWVAALAQTIWRKFQARYSLGVVGVLFNDEGKVLLVEHVFHPAIPWGLPGGWVDGKEGPQTALQRELMEELSLEVEVGPVLLTHTPIPQHVDLAFLCKAHGEVGVLSYELLRYQWLDPEDLPDIHSFHRQSILRALEVLRDTEYKEWLQD